MARLFFNSENCQGATSERTGRHYKTDKQGFITVNDPAEAKFFKANGYIEAGAMPILRKYWICEDCNWEASINSCGKCGSENLRKVEK